VNSNLITPDPNTTAYVSGPDGRVAYDVAGDGPLVILVPGMGDLRSSYRYLAPALRKAGYRVACTDLRGHGDSDTTFASYGDLETAGDILALIDALDGPAVVVGNSMAAGAAVIAAAQKPDLVRGLVLVGPFVRNGNISTLQRLLLRAAMARPWAAITWRPTYRSSTPVNDLRTSPSTVTKSLSACAARDTRERSPSRRARTTHPPRPTSLRSRRQRSS